MNATGWTDSHCHIPYEGVGTEVIDRARLAGVTRLITVGTDLAQSEAAVSVAHAHEGVWATVGVHPHDAKDGMTGIAEMLAEQDPAIVAVGECGLDYHYDLSERAVQRVVFAEQVRLASEHDLALVIHTRNAWDDTFDILRAEGAPERTIFHCFTGGPEEATRAIDVGAWLSFSGIVTFKNASEVRAAVQICSLDRLLVETDSPFLTPVPHRGRPNSPEMVPLVGEAVAVLRAIPVAEIAATTSANATAAFSLPVEPSDVLPPSGE